MYIFFILYILYTNLIFYIFKNNILKIKLFEWNEQFLLFSIEMIIFHLIKY